MWLPASSDSKMNKQLTQSFLFSTNLPYLSYIGSVNYQDVSIGYVLLTFEQSLLIQAPNKTLYTQST
ncbi:MAG: hypothetical protein LC437_01980 [Thiohalomonas sp.]|nr:hypothetical protein [Thiohalomonas sp.]